jgi:hypothetical protein
MAIGIRIELDLDSKHSCKSVATKVLRPHKSAAAEALQQSAFGEAHLGQCFQGLLQRNAFAAVFGIQIQFDPDSNCHDGSGSGSVFRIWIRKVN